MISTLRTVSRETVLLPVRLWRLVSRFAPDRCLYHPSCSAYCLTAVRRHGVVYGSALTVWRLLRCNPWSLGGIDPVPPCPPRCAASDAAAWRPATRHRSSRPTRIDP